MKKLLPLFLSQSLRTVAVSLLSFFSAVYIYKQSGSFLFILLFDSIYFLSKIIGLSLAENLSLKLGLKWQMAIGNLFTAFCLISFFLSKQNLSYLISAAAWWGLAVGFFWFGRHGMVIKMAPGNRFGQTLGASLGLETTFHLFLPFIGGAIITEFGYSGLFTASLLFVLFSILVSLPIKNIYTHQDVTLKETLKLIWRHKRMSLAYLSIGAINEIYTAGLIIYVFLNIKKELNLGIFLSLSMFLVAIYNYFVCLKLDSGEKKKFIVPGVLINSFAWLGRFFSFSYLPLFIFDVLGRIGGGMTGYPMEVLSFQKAIEGKSAGQAILFRELAIISGSFLGIMILAVIVLSGISLRYAFLIAALLGLLKMLIIDKKGIIGDGAR